MRLPNNTVAWPERIYFYAHPGKIPKTMARIAYKIGATLKGKNLLQEGKSSPLRAAPVVKKQKPLYYK